MDPIITNGIDPALLRVVEKRGQERDPEQRRRRAPPISRDQERQEQEQEQDADAPKHELDDLA